ncbi:probable splicing factor, arginine/serine-rich 7 [Coregonus clupeaformis]|uniref:probable splicing factor, arginine/serine-rich 7 n=1 Tax=Coregonus clupeaformis TaxID=59861 RepID=UPI001E1C299E|nr:probable splicing factor, arginine/serine-rich 7 [Coregonus clupeaformis]XP_045063907.1 probable splicing factor, arginine/serine-rich 7 [Coregonus clupeaformis]
MLVQSLLTVQEIQNKVAVSLLLENEEESVPFQAQKQTLSEVAAQGQRVPQLSGRPQETLALQRQAEEPQPLQITGHRRKSRDRSRSPRRKARSPSPKRGKKYKKREKARDGSMERRQMSTRMKSSRDKEKMECKPIPMKVRRRYSIGGIVV